MEFDIKLKPSDLVVEIKKMIRSASLHHPSPLLKTPRREASAGGSSRCLTGPVLLPIQTGLSIKVLRIMLECWVSLGLYLSFHSWDFYGVYHKDGAENVASVNYILCHLMCGSDFLLK